MTSSTTGSSQYDLFIKTSDTSVYHNYVVGKSFDHTVQNNTTSTGQVFSFNFSNNYYLHNTVPHQEITKQIQLKYKSGFSTGTAQWGNYVDYDLPITQPNFNIYALKLHTFLKIMILQILQVLHALHIILVKFNF